MEGTDVTARREEVMESRDCKLKENFKKERRVEELIGIDFGIKRCQSHVNTADVSPRIFLSVFSAHALKMHTWL